MFYEYSCFLKDDLLYINDTQYVIGSFAYSSEDAPFAFQILFVLSESIPHMKPQHIHAYMNFSDSEGILTFFIAVKFRAHQEQFGIQYLAQGHFDMQTARGIERVTLQ